VLTKGLGRVGTWRRVVGVELLRRRRDGVRGRCRCRGRSGEQWALGRRGSHGECPARLGRASGAAVRRGRGGAGSAPGGANVEAALGFEGV